VVERVLEAELTAHRGYAPYGRYGTEDQHARHGQSHQTVQTDTGPWPLEVPRDRKGRLMPRRVPKRQRRLAGFDDHVLRLSARGLSTRAIQGPLEDLYGRQVSPPLLAASTEAGLEEGRTWQARPLASL
jgi:transposase-like protein